jgi:hypothetical protein
MESEVVIASLSLVVSAAAIFLSIRSNRRAEITTRTRIFVELRTRFLDIREDLPDLSVPRGEWSPEQKIAAKRYWLHTFDEWYVTNKLNEALMLNLWNSFYSKAVQDGLRHKELRASLVSMLEGKQELLRCFPEFEQELRQLWAEAHPAKGSECTDLDCDH